MGLAPRRGMHRWLVVGAFLGIAAAGAPMEPSTRPARGSFRPDCRSRRRGRSRRRRLRKLSCATCHGVDGKGGFANPNAETDGKVPGVIFVAEGYTRKELRQKIADGLATIGKADQKGPRPPYRMPGWAGRMTERETADLVEFLFSLYPESESQTWR